MYAKKANKVYRVDDVTKEGYLKQGYDICDDEGNIIEHSPQATVPYAEYEKLRKELEELKETTTKRKKTAEPDKEG